MCKSGEGVNSGTENGGWPLSQGGGAEENGQEVAVRSMRDSGSTFRPWGMRSTT